MRSRMRNTLGCGLAAIRRPQPRQCDSMSFGLRALDLRTENFPSEPERGTTHETSAENRLEGI